MYAKRPISRMMKANQAKRNAFGTYEKHKHLSANGLLPYEVQERLLASSKSQELFADFSRSSSMRLLTAQNSPRQRMMLASTISSPGKSMTSSTSKIDLRASLKVPGK